MIPGVKTFHPRESWVDPAYPITGPADNPANNDTVVIHYTAADDLIDGDPGEYATALPAYMRAMQRSYVVSRGYSLGYLFAVDWLGGVWQIRGWDIQSAANAGHNNHTWPVLMLVDGNDGATAEAAASVRAIVAEATRRAGRPQTITGHGQLSGAATSCPGVGLRAQIAAGVFVPLPTPNPQPAQEVDMIRIDLDSGTSKWTSMVIGATTISHTVDGNHAAVLARAGVAQENVSKTELLGILQSLRATNASPFAPGKPAADPALHAAWEKALLKAA